MELKEEEIAKMTERQEAVQLELQRARDELRVERAKWKEEMDTVTQVSDMFILYRCCCWCYTYLLKVQYNGENMTFH